MISFEYHNATHMLVRIADFGIEQEMQDFFSFRAPGYKFHPKVRAGIWDGVIKLFDLRRKTLYVGLLELALKFCKDRGYEFAIDPTLNPKTGISEDSVAKFIESLALTARGQRINPRDYQITAVQQALSSKRKLLLSPTSSGKSMILYSLLRYHLDVLQHRVLIVVPTTMLVEQLFSDFADYSTENGWSPEENIQLLYSGKERLFVSNVMISTWQSLHAMQKNQPGHFNELVAEVDAVFFDEAHTYKAAAVLQTMEKLNRTHWRTGTTGTIDNNKINELSLIGLIGPIYRVISTKELMDTGQVTELKIKALLLQYPEHVRKAMKGLKYQDEVNFIIANDARNRFIANLTRACSGTTLILFNYVERHGAVIHELVQQRLAGTGRSVYFIHGGTDGEDREKIRLTAEHEKDAVIIATASLFSTGINMPSIQNIIFAVPSKSTIRIRQSIGRGLRLKDGKAVCNLYDIVDDLSYKSFKNTTLKHFQDRVAIYDAEQFSWSLVKVDLENVIK